MIISVYDSGNTTTSSVNIGRLPHGQPQYITINTYGDFGLLGKVRIEIKDGQGVWQSYPSLTFYDDTWHTVKMRDYSVIRIVISGDPPGVSVEVGY